MRSLRIVRHLDDLVTKVAGDTLQLGNRSSEWDFGRRWQAVKDFHRGLVRKMDHAMDDLARSHPGDAIVDLLQRDAVGDEAGGGEAFILHHSHEAGDVVGRMAFASV